MSMNSTYRNAIANHGASLITHIGLVNDLGQQVGDGRRPVTWTLATDGTVRPNADLVYTIAAGQQVSAWRAYSASSGGTLYGGGSLGSVTFGNSGQYTLVAAQTGINHIVAA